MNTQYFKFITNCSWIVAIKALFLATFHSSLHIVAASHQNPPLCRCSLSQHACRHSWWGWHNIGLAQFSTQFFFFILSSVPWSNTTDNSRSLLLLLFVHARERVRFHSSNLHNKLLLVLVPLARRTARWGSSSSPRRCESSGGKTVHLETDWKKLRSEAIVSSPKKSCCSCYLVLVVEKSRFRYSKAPKRKKNF